MKYRQVGLELLERMKEVTRVEYKVLWFLIEESNEKDNCINTSLTEISRMSGVSNGSVSRAVKKFESQGVLKKGVIDIHGKKCIMLNPRMVWSTSRSLIHFAQNMYDTGSHFEAYEASKVGEELGGKLDASTGELYSEYQHRYGDTYDIEGNLKRVSRRLYDNQG